VRAFDTYINSSIRLSIYRAVKKAVGKLPKNVKGYKKL
jgi:hypothetical protein